MKIHIAAFHRMEKDCASLKIYGFSGRLTDERYCFHHQCSHWFWKRLEGTKGIVNSPARVIVRYHI